MAKRRKPRAPTARQTEVTTGANFKLVFLGVVGLTVLSALVCIVFGFFEKTESKGLIESFAATWKIGFGAVMGLIGGKKLH